MRQGSRMPNADHGPKVVDQDIYEESIIQKYPLGTRFVLGDRVFRYAMNGTSAALASGRLMQAEVPVANHTAQVLATTIAANSVKTVNVTLGGTAVTKNQYADGWLWVEGGTNIGACYKIKSHPVQAGTTSNVIMTLYDLVAEALTASTETISFVKNIYKDVIIHPAPPSAVLAGVPLIDITISTSTVKYYFWLQTAGPAGVLAESGTKTLVIGEDCVADDSVDGAVSGMHINTNSDVIVGRVIDIAADGAIALVDLSISY